MSVVTAMPTMCANPDKLTPDELLAELLRMQREVIQIGDALHKMNVIAHNQASLLDGLVFAHRAGNKDGISQQLQVLSDHRATQERATH